MNQAVVFSVEKLKKLAEKASSCKWYVNTEETYVCLENGKNVLAKTDDNWKNNARYISELAPGNISYIVEQVLELKGVSAEVKKVAREAFEFAKLATPGPWKWNDEKESVINGEEVGLISWLDFNDVNNSNYVAHCRPENILKLIAVL